MRRLDIARLFLLALIWGASFLLMRIEVPALGAMLTANARVAIAAVALIALLIQRGVKLKTLLRPEVLIVGISNSALPFALFAWGSRTLPAGYLAVLNATSPLFGALLAAFWLDDPLTPRKLSGLAAGIGGVTLLVRLGPVALSEEAVVAVVACLLGALSYAFATNYMKRHRSSLPPTVLATGSQVAATLVLIPFAWVGAGPVVTSMSVALGMLLLGLVCTAGAYLLYFRLVTDVGPAKALTVTFLVPLFAMFWGALVLGEVVTPRFVAGALAVLAATWLVAFDRRQTLKPT